MAAALTHASVVLATNTGARPSFALHYFTSLAQTHMNRVPCNAASCQGKRETSSPCSKLLGVQSSFLQALETPPQWILPAYTLACDVVVYQRLWV